MGTFCMKYLFIQHLFASKFKKVAIKSEIIILNQIILLYIKVMNTTHYFYYYDGIDLLFYNLFWLKSNIFSRKLSEIVFVLPE